MNAVFPVVSPSPILLALARQPGGPSLSNDQLNAWMFRNGNRRNSTQAQSRDLFGSGGANKQPVGSRNSARWRASFRELKKIEKEHAS